MADDNERTVEDVQREIEHARSSLAATVDELAYRTNPKRIAGDTKQRLVARAQTPQGKAVLGAAAAFLALAIIVKVVAARRHSDD